MNIITRVFRIKCNSSTGTGYVIEVHDRQHLVSAAHIFAGIEHIDTIEIYKDGMWCILPVTVVYNTRKIEDTIVFLLPHDICNRLPINIGTQNIGYSQRAYFLGFPFGITLDGGEFNDNYPIPFVKTAIVSAVDGQSHSGITIIYLDGHNNRGFSGGPVVCYPEDHGIAGSKDPVVLGTITGSLYERVTIVGSEDEMDLYEVNAGIIRAVHIDNIITKIPLP